MCWYELDLHKCPYMEIHYTWDYTYTCGPYHILFVYLYIKYARSIFYIMWKKDKNSLVQCPPFCTPHCIPEGWFGGIAWSLSDLLEQRIELKIESDTE